MTDDANGNPGPLWLLPRGVGLALDGKKLILAAVGLILLQWGWLGLDRVLPTSPEPTTRVVRELPDLHQARADDLVGLISEAARTVARPATTLARPFVVAGRLDARPQAVLHAVLAGLWGLLVWSLIGAAIARSALMQVTSPVGEGIGLKTALGFALKRVGALLSAPVAPLVGLGLFALLGAGIGTLYRAGAVGSIVAGCLWLPLLLTALGASIALVGLILGWPLMVVTVAAEAEDGFDALSRSFGYLQQLPLRFVWYVAISWGLGTLGVLLVAVFSQLTVHLATWSTALGAPDELLFSLVRAPRSAGPVSVAARVHTFAIWLVHLLAYSWVYAYFWTAASLIYLRLRTDVDGCEWDDIDRLEPWDETTAFSPDQGGSSAAPEST